MKKAIEYLNEAAAIQQERGKVYEGADQERSMAKIVTAFNAATGLQLTEREGWMFMIVLKAVRAMAKAEHHEDSWQDLVSYSALAAECSALRRDIPTKKVEVQQRRVQQPFVRYPGAVLACATCSTQQGCATCKL